MMIKFDAMKDRRYEIDGNNIEYRSIACNDLRGTPCIFFDRDGVLISDTGYVGRPEDVILTERCLDALNLLSGMSFALVIVTNQSGIGRGYFDWHAFNLVHDRLLDLLGFNPFSAVYACGYYDKAPDIVIPAHPWRKPNPGMILSAASDLGVDLNRSWIIGDRESDISAGFAAGLAGGMFISEQESTTLNLLTYGSKFVYHQAKDVFDACQKIILQLGERESCG